MCISLCKEYDLAYTSLQQFVVYEKVGVCIRGSLFSEKPLRAFERIRYDSGLFGRDDKRRQEKP
jgi:hypothetical protein